MIKLMEIHLMYFAYNKNQLSKYILKTGPQTIKLVIITPIYFLQFLLMSIIYSVLLKSYKPKQIRINIF